MVPPEQWRAREEFLHCLDYLNSVVDNVRRIARNLRPSVLEDLGLSAGLRVLIEEFSKYHEVEVSLEMDDIEGLFTRDEEINLYRIFQETLTNIAKHAKAKRISIVLLRRSNEVSFKVTDDGVGFDLEQVLVRDAAEEDWAGRQMTTLYVALLTIRSRETRGLKFHLRYPSSTPGTLSGGLSVLKISESHQTRYSVASC
jgi:signal transduction histidine kinase